MDFERELRGRVGALGSVNEALTDRERRRHAVSLREFSERWMIEYAATNNSLSEQRHKRGALRNHILPLLGDLRIDRVRTADIERFKAALIKRGLCAKSINNYLVTLQTCLRIAREWEVVESVPLVRMLPRTPPPYRHLSPEQVERLVASSPYELIADMIKVAAHTGLRFGELIALDWSDVSFEDNMIVVQRNEVLGVVQTPKSHKIRHVPMSSPVRQTLHRRRSQSGRVFLREGQRIRQGWALKQLALACEVAGIPRIGWHALRHTFASELARRGAPIVAIKDLLGHSTIDMTMRYAHLSQSALHAAIGLLPSCPSEAVSTWRQPEQKRDLEMSPSPVCVTPASWLN